MKKAIISITVVMLLISISTFAQTPELMKYQAVARDNAGNVLNNQLISFRISILQGSSSGTSAYSETHLLTTNDFGLANLTIGTGTIESEIFSSIDWSSDLYFLQVEMDESGGTNYQLMGTSQLLSVPYALFAKTADSLTKGVHKLSDTDGDTKIQVEKNSNEDIIRFDMAGTEFFKMDSGRLEVLNTGHSVFVGEGAGANDDFTDNYNTVVGSQALHSNTTGSTNTAIGYQTLTSNSSGFGNHAIGYLAMKLNTTGVYNIAMGNQALFLNTTGNSNVAIGTDALHFNTEGEHNTAVGTYALYLNGTANNNVAVGYNALRDNNSGSRNVAVGTDVLMYNVSGSHNTAIGNSVLYNNTSGLHNTAIGTVAMYFNISGIRNTAIGSHSLNANTEGSYNTATGYYSLRDNTSGEDNTTSGAYSLLFNTTGNYNTAFGSRALHSNETGNKNTATGYQALYNNTQSNNTATGYQALYNNTQSNNTAIGYQALHDNSTGYENTAVGSQALSNTTTAGRCVGIGYQAGYNNETGFYNTAVGYKAGPATSDIKNSTAIGRGASTTAWNQIRIGNNIVTSIGGYAGWTNISDKQFNKAIQNDIVGLDFIMALQPISYQLDMDKLEEKTGNKKHASDSSYKETEEERKFNLQSKMVKGSIRQSGFLAQDVEQAAQDVGYDFSGVDAPKNEDDFYGLRYAEFVVPLVKGMQEQQAIIELQNLTIDDLLKRIEQLESHSSK